MCLLNTMNDPSPFPPPKTLLVRSEMEDDCLNSKGGVVGRAKGGCSRHQETAAGRKRRKKEKRMSEGPPANDWQVKLVGGRLGLLRFE